MLDGSEYAEEGGRGIRLSFHGRDIKIAITNADLYDPTVIEEVTIAQYRAERLYALLKKHFEPEA